jgi:hypothetical protein
MTTSQSWGLLDQYGNSYYDDYWRKNIILPQINWLWNQGYYRNLTGSESLHNRLNNKAVDWLLTKYKTINIDIDIKKWPKLQGINYYY